MGHEARPLGIFIWYGYALPIARRARLAREAGFVSALHWWSDEHMEAEGLSRAAQADAIRREGLAIENAHLPADQVNDLWRDGVDGDAALARYLADIDSLADAGIATCVLHPTSGKAPPPVSDVGLARFRALAERAQTRGVRIALENMRHPARLAPLLDGIDVPSLGFCYDSGHDLVWSDAPLALLHRYAHRLFAVHLHDNHGDSDAHLPPGEGRVDWPAVRAGIERSAYHGPYTLECGSGAAPKGHTARGYLLMARAGARRVLTRV